jgi:CheY-like chemotaxis protein
MIELLLDTRLDSEQHEFVTVVGDSAQELLRIINDILDFSKMEADKLVLDSVEFEPVDVVEGATELLAARAREKGISLMTYVDPEIPSLLRGDSARLRQVLLNLVGNAVKFTERGDVAVRALLERVSGQEVTVRFEVQDTGIGLSEVARRRLFQAFVQADGSTTRKYGGTGLGLAICKRLTEMMGGTIDVESVEGQGSTFWFTARFGAVAGAGRPQPASGKLEGVRALIADGSQMSRETLRRVVESLGMSADDVPNGWEALNALMHAPSTAPYDVIITDFVLPDMDGFEFTRSMRENPILRARADVARTPVIALTAQHKRGQGEAAVKAGFAAYLTKPSRRSQIVDAVANALWPSEGTVEAAEPEISSPAIAPVAARFGWSDGETRPAEEATTSALDTHPAEMVVRPGTLILLVEDNVNNQVMTMRQLEKLGCGVHIVSNGLQAVKALAYGSRYDLVFMDCQMPGMDGFTATREIRKSEVSSGRHIPIIAMTANAMSGDRENCIAAGMDDYIPKPISRHILREALRRWLPAPEVAA